MGTLVYKFGLLPPTEGESTVRAEILGGHRYANDLVAVERARREALREHESKAGDLPALDAAAREADTVYEAALRDVTRHRARSRRKDEPPEMKAAVKDARETRKAAKDALREARHRLREADVPPPSYLAQKAVEEKHGKRSPEKYAAELVLMADPLGGRYGIEARVNFWLRALRKEDRACAWGTGGLVEASRDAKRKMPLWQEVTKPNDPRFRAATRAWAITEEGHFTRRGLPAEGRLGVQIQAGKQAPMSAILSGEHRQVKLVRQAHDPCRGRRMGQRFTLSLRLGSDGGEPVWASWPAIVHRPIPPAGVITNVEVLVRQEAGRERWTAQLTVRLPEEERSCGRGVVAIDLGWRLLPSGDLRAELPSGDLRVAAWRGDDGEHGELTIAAKHLGTFAHAEELRSLRDDLFDRARLTLTTRLAALELPAWMVTATAYLAQWKAPAKLDALAVRWRTGRFPGDEDAYVDLETWRQKNKHLWQWEAGDRRKADARRKDLYRVFAATLARRYETCVWEDVDLSQLARRAGADVNRTAARHRFLAACGELRLQVQQAFRRRGGANVEVSAVDSTHICHVCGSVEEFDAEAHLRHVCSACGTEWDQDDNATYVLLARHRERSNDVQTAAGAREGDKERENTGLRETKWSRANRMALEKQARIAGARDAASKPAE